MPQESSPVGVGVSQSESLERARRCEPPKRKKACHLPEEPKVEMDATVSFEPSSSWRVFLSTTASAHITEQEAAQKLWHDKVERLLYLTKNPNIVVRLTDQIFIEGRR